MKTTYDMSWFGDAFELLAEKVTWDSGAGRITFISDRLPSPTIPMATFDNDAPEVLRGSVIFNNREWKCFLLDVDGSTNGIAGWVESPESGQIYFHGYQGTTDPYVDTFPDLPSEATDRHYRLYRLKVGEGAAGNPFNPGNVLNRGFEWKISGTTVQLNSFQIFHREPRGQPSDEDIATYGLPLIVQEEETGTELWLELIHSDASNPGWAPNVWSLAWREKSTATIIKSVIISPDTASGALRRAVASVKPEPGIGPIETPGVFCAEYP